MSDGPERDIANTDVRQILEEMYLRQQQMESELATTRAALVSAESRRFTTATDTTPSSEPSMTQLVKTLIETLSTRSTTDAGVEMSGPREWKPPTWDGRAETFRDYLLRLRSSYRVRSATKPTLSIEYYWDTVYSTLPIRERSRMRHFWERGSVTRGKDPEAFFAQLEDIFADSNEQAKALERLTHLRHTNGQPWHEHQLEFDGLLLSADGESWNDATKIGYLKNTFSNTAKIYTAAVPKTTDYYVFSEEVERIMTNLEATDQFKAAHKRWLREKNKDPEKSTTVTTHSHGVSTTTRVDADGDTVMAPTHTNGNPRRNGRARSKDNGKRRAKWVDAPERERRRRERLCFRCGGSGHHIRECPYAPAVQPLGINAVYAKPLLEGEDDSGESAAFSSGKERLSPEVEGRE